MDTALPENSTLIVKIKKEAMGSGKDFFMSLILNLSTPIAQQLPNQWPYSFQISQKILYTMGT